VQDKYRNRYGDTYYYEQTENEKVFKFVMEGDSMRWCRFGGKEGQDSVDMNELGMFDPSGGPYVEIGSTLCIGKVKRLYHGGENVMIEVE
jgi:hypothetical protein